MNKKLGVAAFCVGLAAVCWVGLGLSLIHI